MTQDIKETLKDIARNVEQFPLACDETTEIKNTAQLTIFEVFELLFLQVMHGTIKDEDLFQ